MDLAEAMQALKDGKKVRMIKWGEGEYIHLVDKEILDENARPLIVKLRAESWDDWELCIDPPKTYSFAEMISLLKKGSKMRRKGWGSGFYISQVYGSIFDSKGHFYRLLIHEIEATDWVEVK